MIEAESSSVRSVNSGVICGAVTRRIRKAKKPTSATVTAAIAAMRAAPSDFRNSKRPCTTPPRPMSRDQASGIRDQKAGAPWRSSF